MRITLVHRWYSSIVGVCLAPRTYIQEQQPAVVVLAADYIYMIRTYLCTRYFLPTNFCAPIMCAPHSVDFGFNNVNFAFGNSSTVPIID